MMDNPEVVAAALAFVVTFPDAGRRYYRNEDVKLYELPWLEFRTLFEYARRRTFTIERPDRPSFVERGLTLEEFKTRLGNQGVKPRHPFSFVYSGEVYNGVLYFYDSSRTKPHRQIHVRAFEAADGLEVMAHEEPHWYLHPIAHLRSKDLEHEPANEWVQRRLENEVPVGYPAE